MVKKHLIFVAMLALLVASLAGCSSGKEKDSADPGQGQGTTSGSKDPITLKMYIQDVTIPDELFKNWIADPVKAKYPHITMELVRRPANTSLAQLVSTGDFADMVYEGSATMYQFIQMQIVQDLMPLLKKNNMDLSKFDPVFINTLKAYSDKEGELYALPLSTTFNALFYNKDLFDKFNVPYPKDGITWEEAVQLMKRLTRSDGGTQYHGLRAIHNLEAFGSPFAFKVYDEKTGRAVMADGWRKVFEMYREIKSYPGNDTGGAEPFDNFTTKQDYAMFAEGASGCCSGYTLIKIQEAANKGMNLNWDMVKYPRFEGNADRGLEFGGHILMMTAATKHKDAVMDVMSLLTDREVQLKITKDARLPALKDPEIRKHFGETYSVLKGKNMTPVFDQGPAPAVIRKKEEVIARGQIRPAGNLDTAFMKGQADVNRALAEIEEKANKALQDAKK